jgi:ribonuclease E
MANKMLIDATHPEETRVVVVRGNRVEEFDFESASRRQLRGNIYLAKVTRVEPSLQAAFVEYGGNRHGFLAFSEIHPDYYQIPVADRQALIAEEERAQREADDEVDRRPGRGRGRSAERPRRAVRSEVIHDEVGPEHAAPAAEATADFGNGDAAQFAESSPDDGAPATGTTETTDVIVRSEPEPAGPDDEPERGGGSIRPEDPVEAHGEALAADPDEYVTDPDDHHPEPPDADYVTPESSEAAAAFQDRLERAPEESDDRDAPHGNGNGGDENGEEEEVVESVGGDDAIEEATERLPRIRRQYKIQEVIKRRQIMLVQVVKEERGTKGAALTTYLSLAGRYSVLMPNTARGGGISRKITSAQDRKRLKEVAQELEVPDGMGVILRTAGSNRTKAEIKRDFEYLLRLWEQVRDLTLKSTAPMLVYEEGSLIKRAIRDLYNKDIDEVLVAGDDAYHEAKDFMRTLMPSHAKNVKPYRDTQPIFTRYGAESQLDAMFSPVVQLKSGGYIVLNQAEALVAIDVNSGRATREHHIEDTAFKTNLEAADEVARQLRLRDLAGLIVIDFIDMDEKRNNRAVERRLKESLKHDRARIQVGRISHFGLLEMSRQRIRSSVLESSTEKCPHCGGMGHVRSVGSVALQLLRSLEEMLIKGATHNLIVRTRADVALYVLNQKRAHLRELETRFRISVAVNSDPTIAGQQPFAIERGEQVHSLEAAKAIAAQLPSVAVEAEEEEATAEEASLEQPAEEEEGDADRKYRRRRRRRRGGDDRQASEFVAEAFVDRPVARAEERVSEGLTEGAEAGPEEETDSVTARDRGPETRDDADRRRRRRGRRGGRRNRREREDASVADPGSVEPELESAVADFDRDFAPAAESQPAPSEPEPVGGSDALPEPREAVREEASPIPVTPEAIAPEQPPDHEPARRRSTVREPAPFAIGSGEGSVAPRPPAPSVPTESIAEQPEDAQQPRRTGWWSRRLVGDGKP